MAVVSSRTPYLTVAGFLNRADVRDVQKLVSIDGIAVATGSLATNDRLVACVEDANGAFEAAALRGERYTVAKLQAIRDTDCMSRRLMFRIIANIAWGFLFDLRPDPQPSPGLYARMEMAMTWLGKLEAGEWVFGDQDNLDASHMSADETDIEDADRFYGQVQVARRYFGRRSNDFRDPRG